MPTAQMRRPAAAVLRRRRGDFSNSLFVQRHLHDHLAGELHPGSSEIEFHGSIFPEASQAAMKISRRALEQKPADEGKDWIAEILVQRRHSVRLDTAAKAIAHDQIVAFAQF